jgi:hypothetical protein
LPTVGDNYEFQVFTDDGNRRRRRITMTGELVAAWAPDSLYPSETYEFELLPPHEGRQSFNKCQILEMRPVLR